MQQLNLPTCDLKIKNEEGNQFVLDIIRKKYVVLTAEEWVRQHFIHLMVNHLKYPKSLLKIESGLSYFKSSKRSDINLMNSDGSLFLVLECKAPDVKINQKALNQISVYNKELQAQYVALTNGLQHFIWLYDKKKEQYQQLPKFPAFK
ncbi:type I restriction enzyme HsdR N-terminal domain-containing protein [Marinoscillum pacificum]|uniref:type I restriction enzyme HsdR N-terminal domain-containing protein n=1 Tax=Marinoscillum pacificum TaxID=392723 RepID=UPI002157B79A|nr:type I restriction enzyme HsdR N-terminal domain-containing protein [Marinoscillum pacificum]